MDRSNVSLDVLVGLLRTSDLLKQVLKKDVANYNLNMTEFAVLELLHHKGEQPIQQIGARILIASSSTTYVIDKLVAKNLVSRRTSSEDKRMTFASNTAAGTALMAEIFPQHAARITELFTVLDDEELKVMKKALLKIGREAKG